MVGDKWSSLIHDELDDLEGRAKQIRARYWQRAVVFIVFIVGGAVLMLTSSVHSRIVLGCFLAVTGVVGQCAMATMAHAELCLYRTVIELRKHAGGGS